jgi:hypothetical protein
MRCFAIACAILVLGSIGRPQDRKPARALPSELEIATDTFVDSGPPFNFYEISMVRPTANGAHIERIYLTPPADECFTPAKIETAEVSTASSVASLFGETNPCAIPEKTLRRELTRCKHCGAFSGSDVLLQVHCGDQTRSMRSYILDRDFAPSAKLTDYTSWMMHLLDRLDKAVEKEQPARSPAGPAILQDLSLGKYDALFKGSPDKPSALYRASLKLPAVAAPVRLVSSTPFALETFVLPEYPLIAKTARIQGSVSVESDVDSNGALINLALDGPPLLFQSVSNAAKDWRFPKGAFGQHIHVTILFDLNCPKPTH